MELNGLRVSRETSERLRAFSALFEKWAKSINLVAPSTLSDLWQRHIADSAQVFQLYPNPVHWIDLGSGGGFPGIITSIFLAELGEGHVDLIESNQKKAAFLRSCLRECGGRGSVHCLRIEQAQSKIPECDAISARALGDLSLLLDYAVPWAQKNVKMRLFLHKGRDYQREVDAAHGRFDFDLVKHDSVVEMDSVILEISNPQRRT